MVNSPILSNHQSSSTVWSPLSTDEKPYASKRATPQTDKAASPKPGAHTKPRQRTPTPTTKKAPWRNPGNWQIPDIIGEAWKKHQEKKLQQKKQEEQQKQNARNVNKDNDKKNTGPKKEPWRSVRRSPDILPLPPAPATRPVQKDKPHAEFDGKLRKRLPSSKILETNPNEKYVGFAKIGSGANGAVIRAYQLTNPKIQVAIKRCYIEDHDRAHHAYVLRELKIMGCLSHPNLIRLREAALWKDDLWMAMELMTCSVFNLLYNTTTGLSEGMTIRIARECLEGLIYLHSKNYMHRDIKCENILLGRDGQVKLADFGLATPLNIVNKARLGTAKWMAPEVISEIPYTENVDVWSLAITMIEMTDRVPPLYNIDDNRDIFCEILYGRPLTFTFSVPSRTLSDLVSWMLDSDAERRPGARCVLTNIKQLVRARKLECAKQSDLARLVQKVFPESQ